MANNQNYLHGHSTDCSDLADYTFLDKDATLLVLLSNGSYELCRENPIFVVFDQVRQKPSCITTDG